MDIVSSGEHAIAVIGMSCRFPAAPDTASFWRLLWCGQDAIAEPPEARRLGGPPGAFLTDVEGFDAEFFGIPPREAAMMDPQQRLMLELGWEAVEDARIRPDRLAGSRAGVFVGAMATDYAAVVRAQGPGGSTPHTFTGLSRAVIANRLSDFLGLCGPSLTVDTGQSSSLVAVQMAVESLRRGECDLAIAGGVHLDITAESTADSVAFGALSPDGRCFTFDARANGYARGEGGGAVVLKPAAQAIADRDHVYAVIVGAAVGAGSGRTLTTPSESAQEDVLRRAYEQANIDPSTVDYVELHGTGTKVGDPVEAAALGAVLGAGRPPGRPLLVGSVKTNLGHLEGAAGIAGLIKTCLSVSHRRLPPSLNFTRPNPGIPLDELGLRVVCEPTDWPSWPSAGGSPSAGVSSFGMGGTNCHVVLSAASPRPLSEPGNSARPVPWMVSGASPQALRDQANRLADHLAAGPSHDPADVAYSLVATRRVFAHRAAVVAERTGDLVAGLRTIASGGAATPDGPGIVRGRPVSGGLAYLFPGQGAQRTAMGRALHAAFPAFAEAFDAVCAEADAALGRSLREIIWSGEADLLNQTRYAQPALFTVEVATYRLLESCGVRPDMVAGHSVGEIAAAHVAGVLSLRDAVEFVVARGSLMQGLPPGGGMIALEATEEEVRPFLRRDRVALAAINGPTSVVVSGDAAELARIAERFRRRSRRVRPLAVSHAFHSPLMDPVLPELRAVAGRLTFHPADGVLLMSGVTGRPAADPDLRSPGYWATHAREAVRFGDCVAALHAAGARVFAECGPGHALTRAAGQNVPVSGSAFLAGADSERELVTLLAALHTHGGEPDWQTVLGAGRRTVGLPAYPFQRRRHWVDTLYQSPAPEPAGAPRVLDLSGDAVADLVAEHSAAVLGHRDAASVDEATPFNDLGMDSRMAMELRDRLSAATGLDLPATLLFDHPTPATLAAFLKTARAAPSEPDPRPAPAAPSGEPVAIVAMGCRYPGDVRSPGDLWRLVDQGADAISDFPANRGWDPGGGGAVTRRGGFLHDVDRFDPGFFGISPREALAMDPQQRVTLEIVWEAFERYGLDPATLRGRPVGTYLGATHQDYGPRMHEGAGEIGGYLLTGSSPSVISGRVAYAFGFTGPALTVDTACSSSLVALHLAVRALRDGECTMALAGGTTVMASPGMFVEFDRQHGLARDGRCKAFSADADGTAWAEGAGVLVLERLSDARRNGHRVLALVVGSATNQDGTSNGLTAPNGRAQEAVITRALADAGLSGQDVDAVEAHGTGTALGDPIEAQALLAVYGSRRHAGRPLRLGSLKSNIGHAQAAAGVGGVIKMVEAIRAGELPRTLHVREPSPHVDWTAGDVALLTEPVPWPRGSRPRRAAVSSFGISGTNAHVILQEADQEEPEPEHSGEPPMPWVLSARDRAGLRRRARRLRRFIQDDPAAGDGDIAFTLAGRAAHEWRAVVLGEERADFLNGLDALADGTSAPGVVEGGSVRGRTAFVFPGQGSQWPGMAGDLLRTSPAFRAEMEACDVALSKWADWSLIDVVEGAPDAASLSRVDVVQPALFGVMVSLAAVWRSLGVEPDAVVGHSQGEIAAAYAAGALSLDHAVQIVVRRSQSLVKVAGTGGMASVPLPADKVEAVLGRWRGRLEIATVNGPASTTVAGEPEALEGLIAEYAAAGIDVRRIDVDYASHTVGMEPLRADLQDVLAGIEPREGDVPLYSTLTGDLLDTTTMDAGYWYANLRGTVRFQAATRALMESGHTLFVEVSPHPVLTSSVQSTADELSARVVATGTLRRGQGGLPQMLRSAASAYVAGSPVNWRAPAPAGRHVDLPTYPFARERYWLDLTSAAPPPVDLPGSETPPEETDQETVALTALPPADLERALFDLVRRNAAFALGHPDPEELPLDLEFRDLGFDSLSGMDLRNRLSAATGLRLPAALISEAPTPSALVTLMRERLGDGDDDDSARISSGPRTVV
ncbi:acyltransferase domain-containing protein [Actinoallomurus purpureus]|uniref:type I polyketide synthase n=1 Tax=Actinoallomurus purpureus TaxID=478114 RepID=UPI002093C8B1|nr:type I polyketide synthase [Actinoallomurus purpureus]MCO6008425.1 acyltransferase domain-containing protein [Actinoallomurus purpureus]